MAFTISNKSAKETSAGKKWDLAPPLLKENRQVTADVILREDADFGVAFDGDFDRCFIFDGFGKKLKIHVLGAALLEQKETQRHMNLTRVPKCTSCRPHYSR